MALQQALSGLRDALAAKGVEFDDVVKAGRTHLQDAMPIRLGQEFAAYAGSVGRGIKRLNEAADYLRDLGIGGSAVGTGVTVEPRYPALMNTHLRAITGLDLRIGADRVQLMQSMGDVAAFSAALRTLAVDLSKIASDLRLMAMGPRTGIDEITLPAVQPGSSIMPGKINPSIPEMVNQVCFQVIGLDTTVAIASEHGQLELNVMMPVIAYNVLLARCASSPTRCACSPSGASVASRRIATCAPSGSNVRRRLPPRLHRASGTPRRRNSASARSRKAYRFATWSSATGSFRADEADAVLDLRKMTEIGVPGGEHGTSV